MDPPKREAREKAQQRAKRTEHAAEETRNHEVGSKEAKEHEADEPAAEIDVGRLGEYRLVAHGVRNNFHLFSLIQGRLIGDPLDGWLEGPTPDPGILAYARGETHSRPGDSDYAVWSYTRWETWTSDGLRDTPIFWSIWGEMSPRSIPCFKDMPIILLSPLIVKYKSWDANFIASLHDAHTADVHVQTILRESEVEQRLEQFAAATSS